MGSASSLAETMRACAIMMHLRGGRACVHPLEVDARLLHTLEVEARLYY